MTNGSSGAPVPRDGRQRLLNGLALVLIVAGVITYALTLSRMERVAGGSNVMTTDTVSRAMQMVNLERWYVLKRRSNLGLALAGVGVLVAIGATIRQSGRSRRARAHE